MTRHLVAGLMIASLIFAAPRSTAAAQINTVFDTVDTVEINHDGVCDSCTPQAHVVVTGILRNGSVPTTMTFGFASDFDMAAQCERLAAIVMSKPGKYQFAIGSHTSGVGGGSGGGCRLILRAP